MMSRRAISRNTHAAVGVGGGGGNKNNGGSNNSNGAAAGNNNGDGRKDDDDGGGVFAARAAAQYANDESHVRYDDDMLKRNLDFRDPCLEMYYTAQHNALLGSVGIRRAVLWIALLQVRYALI
jgi:hypothetical protein